MWKKLEANTVYYMCTSKQFAWDKDTCSTYYRTDVLKAEMGLFIAKHRAVQRGPADPWDRATQLASHNESALWGVFI